jgi:hypothetical protein
VFRAALAVGAVQSRSVMLRRQCRKHPIPIARPPATHEGRKHTCQVDRTHLYRGRIAYMKLRKDREFLKVSLKQSIEKKKKKKKKKKKIVGDKYFY